MEENTATKKRDYNTTLINKSKVKEVCKGFMVSSAYLEQLEKKTDEFIKDSIIRATGNRRTTLLPRDL